MGLRSKIKEEAWKGRGEDRWDREDASLRAQLAMLPEGPQRLEALLLGIHTRMGEACRYLDWIPKN